MKTILKAMALILIVISAPARVVSDTINFDFTGQLVISWGGSSVDANYPISASLSYDTVSGIGNSDLYISTGDLTFFGSPMFFHDIEMNRVGDTNTISGSVLVDWNTLSDMPLHIEWDATGLFNAINYGLQPGDVLSGSALYHDSNGNGMQDAGEYLTDIDSAIPYSDSIQYDQSYIQGPAPMAATSNSLGLDDTTPFPGIRGYFDIGSGNSMYVTSVSTVPVPAAVWMFGSGLICLISLAVRKK